MLSTIMDVVVVLILLRKLSFCVYCTKSRISQMNGY